MAETFALVGIVTVAAMRLGRWAWWVWDADDLGVLVDSLSFGAQIFFSKFPLSNKGERR